jgi:predicted ester cyclase
VNKLSKNRILSRFIHGVWNDGNADAAEHCIAPSYTIHHDPDLPGFPASGKQIMMSGATVYYFANDRIDEHWQIIDRLGVLQQLSSTA